MYQASENRYDTMIHTPAGTMYGYISLIEGISTGSVAAKT